MPWADPLLRAGGAGRDRRWGVRGERVRLLRQPEELVVVNATTTSPTVAPWLRLGMAAIPTRRVAGRSWLPHGRCCE